MEVDNFPPNMPLDTWNIIFVIKELDNIINQCLTILIVNPHVNHRKKQKHFK